MVNKCLSEAPKADNFVLDVVVVVVVVLALLVVAERGVLQTWNLAL